MPIEIPENKNASVSRPPKIYTCQRICGQDDDRGAFNVCVNVHRTNSPEHHGQGIVPHIVPRDGLYCEESWSEWQDLNLRPPRPERGARLKGATDGKPLIERRCTTPTDFVACASEQNSTARRR